MRLDVWAKKYYNITDASCARPMVKEEPSRLDKELEEVLRYVEYRSRWRRRRRRLLNALARSLLAFRRFPSSIRRPSSPEELMLVSYVLAVVSLGLSFFAPAVGRPLGAVAVFLFLLAYVTYFMKPRYRPRERRWRGQVVDFRPMPWWERLYRWIYG